MIPPLRGAAMTATALAVLVSTAACGSADDGPSSGSAAGSPPGSDGELTVVASTNVWGDIAATIGGPRVHVTSLITDPKSDPHSFQASPRTQLAVSRADVLIENGGGYDDWMTTLRTASKSSAPVVDAVDVSGKAVEAKAAGEELNEHVWYDFPTVEEVADRIEQALAQAAPTQAGTFAANEKTFQGQLEALIAQEAADEPGVSGAGVAITEPVPLYLLHALGAQNRTPEDFSEAIEEGTDVPPAALQQTLALLTGHQVQALAYNEQNTSDETAQVLKAAKENGVAVVPVTETLPDGVSYLTWMQQNLDALDQALSARPAKP